MIHLIILICSCTAALVSADLNLRSGCQSCDRLPEVTPRVRDLDSQFHFIYRRSPIAGISQESQDQSRVSNWKGSRRPNIPDAGALKSRSGQVAVKTKDTSVRAGFEHKGPGIAWTKNGEGKVYHNIGQGGAADTSVHRDKVSAGGLGIKGGVFSAWAMGKKTKVSTQLVPGSELLVKAVQADGSSQRTRYTKPGQVKQEYESGFPGYQMRLETELHGKGKAKVKASQ